MPLKIEFDFFKALPTLDKINDVNKNLNDNVTLKCVASGGDPKPIVQWTKNGQVVTNQQVIIRNNNIYRKKQF